MENHEIESVNPLVSILVVAHNHSAYILPCLEGILNQSHTHLEVFVLNNTIHDGSAELVQTFLRNHKLDWVFEENNQAKTLVQNINQILPRCNGVYFQIISADDIMLPHKIQIQAEALNKAGQQTACCFSPVVYMDEMANPLPLSPYQSWKNKVIAEGKFSPSLRSELSATSFILAPGVLCRTKVLQSIGYSEKFDFEDWPMWLAMSRKGYLFNAVSEVCVLVRALENSSGKEVSPKRWQSLINIFLEFRGFLALSEKRAFLKWAGFIKNNPTLNIFQKGSYFLLLVISALKDLLLSPFKKRQTIFNG